jgi:hypothetical protein
MGYTLPANPSIVRVARLHEDFGGFMLVLLWDMRKA